MSAPSKSDIEALLKRIENTKNDLRQRIIEDIKAMKDAHDLIGLVPNSPARNDIIEAWCVLSDDLKATLKQHHDAQGRYQAVSKML